MPVTGSSTFGPIRHYGKQRVLLSGRFEVGASGAVVASSIKGVGFGTSAVEGRQGSIVRNSAGRYTFTMPGRGPVQAIHPDIKAITAEDVRVTYEAEDLDARSVTIEFQDATNAAEELTSGDIISFMFLVSNAPDNF